MMKPGPLWCLGAMSGTSLDGVDAAMILTDGHAILDFGPDAYRPYNAAEQATIRAALGRWPGDPAVAAAAEVVEAAHAELLSRFSGVDLVGFHGQTLAHDPRGRGTHQAGNGALLAQVLNLPVVWDFRSNDVGMGGQGAPLAPFYHFACARRIGATEPLAFLNLGGVGNLTWVDPRHAAPDHPGACLAFDTGPANAPVNDLMQARFGLAQGRRRRTGRQRHPRRRHHRRLPRPPLFLQDAAQVSGPQRFASLLPAVSALSDADAAATLTVCAAAAVARGTEHFPTPITRLLVTGGGRHNATLVAALTERLTIPVEPIEVANLNGDMLEAQAFAFLAARVAMGLPTSAPGTTGVPAAVGGGQISRP